MTVPTKTSVQTLTPDPQPLLSANATATLIDGLGQEPGVYADNYDGVYTNYWIRMKFFSDKNVFQMPTAQPSGSGNSLPSIVQYADPCDMLTIEWAAVRSGLPPIVPDPNHADPQLILARATVNPQSDPTQAEKDGETLRYIISGMYLYYVIDRSKVVLQHALLPWIDKSMASQMILPQSIFQHGITDAGNGRTVLNPNPVTGTIATLGGTTQLNRVP